MLEEESDIKDNRFKNADRFTGFAHIYENARPFMPAYPVHVICSYLGKAPDTVVDMGCGTGLSTAVWCDVASEIIGIEPSSDMIRIAREKELNHVTFRQEYANETGLDNECADAVVCSQSFHWMEPTSTLKEVNRILKPGGVFAAVDCDWPPVANWEAEHAYMKLYEKIRMLERTLPQAKNNFIRYSKKNHLNNLRNSGYFRYCREIVFSNTERCNAERFFSLLFSQGSLHNVLKSAPELIEMDVEYFKNEINRIYVGNEFEIDFCYRMRIAVK